MLDIGGGGGRGGDVVEGVGGEGEGGEGEGGEGEGGEGKGDRTYTIPKYYKKKERKKCRLKEWRCCCRSYTI